MSKLHPEPGIDFSEFAPELGSGLPDDSGTFRRLPPEASPRHAPAKLISQTEMPTEGRHPKRLLVVGEGADELGRRPPRSSAWSRFEVVTARDADAARAAVADRAPDGLVISSGADPVARGADAFRALLPAGIPTVAVVEPVTCAAGPWSSDIDALVLLRPDESLSSAGTRALEVCRVLVAERSPTAATPESRGGSRGYALLQETHRRLLARMVEARLGQAMVVHDLRAPIGVLRGVHSELGEDPHDPHLLPIMDRALRQLEALVNRLEELHAPERRESQERLDLVELARTVAEEARLTSAARHKTVTVWGEGPIYWTGERQMIERVLSNLIGNALRHTRSQVEIRVEDRHGALRMSVTDDGPGLPEGIRSDLFHRYVRDPATGRLGLGLAIVQSAVEQVGGRVRAYNRCEVSDGASSGACFVVRLPHR